METNPRLGKEMITVIETQIATNNPPETNQTYKRLISEGHTEEEAKKLLACVLTSEMHKILTDKVVFDLARYTKMLNDLPTLPLE